MSKEQHASLRVTSSKLVILRSWLTLLSKRLAFALYVLLAGCSYSVPRWQHRIESGIPLPGSTLAIIAVKSESLRWPEGFIAQFSDGGSVKVVAQRASI
jgi:hypothetical protein